MTAKRFTNIEHDYENAWIKCKDNGDFMIYAIYKELDESLPSLEDLLNGLSEENEQLKKDNEWLFKCVENQSVLIQELDSAIMAYNMEHKITIKLTEKDLKTLDKALSYYTHQEVEE